MTYFAKIRKIESRTKKTFFFYAEIKYFRHIDYKIRKILDITKPWLEKVRALR